MHSPDEMHLDDDRLMAAQIGQWPLRRRERAHLAACGTCAARLREWQAALAGTRATADTVADEAFPADRLARQRRAILDRVQRLESARVLAFPTTPAPVAGRPARLGTRWVAAAAAAGLLVGVVTGQYVNFVPHRPRLQQVAASALARTARLVPGPTHAHARVVPTDDEFLSQVDTAIQSPHVPELQAIDDLTPRIREAAIRVR